MKRERKKIKDIDAFWRNVILFSTLFVLSVPLFSLIVFKFIKNIENFNANMVIKKIEISEDVKNSFTELKKTADNFKELQKQIDEQRIKAEQEELMSEQATSSLEINATSSIATSSATSSKTSNFNY